MTDSPKSKLYLPQLDGLRFFAFLMVFFHHFQPAEGYFAKGFFERNLFLAQCFSWVGVDVFLTLSAFLIFTLLLIERERTGMITMRLFYIRRALRIWPLYFAYLIPAFLLPCFTEPDYHLVPTARYHLAPAMVFLLNFSYIQFPSTSPFTLAHLWTISLEEQFYIFAPIAVLFFADARPRRLAAGIGVLFILTISARLYEMYNSPPYLASWVSPLCRLDPLLVGAGLAFAYRRRPELLTRWRGEWFAAGAIGMFVLITHYPGLRTSPHTAWQLTADALGCGMLIVAVLGRGWAGRVFSWRPLPFLGKISFGLYVYHEMTLHYAPRYAPSFFASHTPADWLTTFIQVLAMTIAIATASYLLYERPFLKLKRRFEIVHSRPA